MGEIGHTGLIAWDAYNSNGKPVCVGSRVTDDTLSVNIYHSNGKITGVTVYDELRLVSASGLIPAETLLNEVQFAGQ